MADMVSAAGAASFTSGTPVQINGTGMNGSIGTIVTYLEQKARWKVEFANGTTKNFKSDNLQVLELQTSDEKIVNKRKQPESTLAPEADTSAEVDSISKVMERLQHESASKSTHAESAPAEKRPKKKHKTPSPANIAAEAACKTLHSGPDGRVNLAGHSFATREELVSFMRAMQERLEGPDGPPDGRLEGADRFLLFHLATQHPKIADKLKAPVTGFRYAVHPHFPKTKCFIMLFADGTDEAVSWMRCVKEVFPPGKAPAIAPKNYADEQAEATANAPKNTTDGEAEAPASATKRNANSEAEVPERDG